MATILPSTAFLHELADAAEKRTLAGYLNEHVIDIESKPKEGFRFDPVTSVDRETELHLREIINERFPEHAILGEEFGESGQGDLQWVIDPIDGTRPFLCGLPVWGCLIGLLQNGKAVMGMMTQPYTGDRFWSDGEQSWFAGRFGKKMMKTRQTRELHQAILHTTSPESVALYEGNHFGVLHEQTLMTRYGGECYAMAMLAAGHIDICVEYSLQPHDIVAFIPVIESAGGVVTTLTGERAEKGGAIVASANAALHEKVLTVLNDGR
ncbi:inositol monophosphatase family protein (plasmid) [Kosakonia sp. SMBL-WEM22]|uniref:inositol monophosphatase family protein n=1 Tax=Kosakonia sp. SMBL-WEM22 TaxID=2725560 RepID=UPI00165A0C40|nr:inositol monophosphatase family protein [Kosakonia sp. SMBL-WEM22]QNQ23016.1 inositol monophosphatase family protein [Kosakonia sp. SMBL-WEM22]